MPLLSDETVSHLIVTEAEFQSHIEDLNRSVQRVRELVALLDECHSLYCSKGSAAVTRMRGWVIAKLSEPQLPPEALPFVLEELETGRSPYLLTLSTHALRRSMVPCPDYARLVGRALLLSATIDEHSNLTIYGGGDSGESLTTIFGEAILTIAWLGRYGRLVADGHPELLLEHSPLSRDRVTQLQQALAQASKCQHVDSSPCCPDFRQLLSPRSWAESRSPRTNEILFENHDGQENTFNEAFSADLTFVVFFYTRCDNPDKCSMTVSKLADLQKRLAFAGLSDRVRTVGVTYDPAFDTTKRMRGYAESRGVIPDANNTLLRAVSGYDALMQHFQLKVNFVGTVVNRHQIEAFIVGRGGKIMLPYERFSWEPEEVSAKIFRTLGKPTSDEQATFTKRHTLLQPYPSQPAKAGQAFQATRMVTPLLAVVIAILPKCPICGVAYLSATGIAALPQLSVVYWVYPILVGLIALNTGAIWLLGRSRGNRKALVLSIAGGATILGGSVLEVSLGLVIGALISICGTILGVRNTQIKSYSPPCSTA